MRLKASFEFSSGGIVKDDGQVLLIRVVNLQGKEVWTFPKGKIEKGELYPDAAQREVLEETGYRCSVGDYLETVKYLYTSCENIIIKTVRWYAMAPLEDTLIREPHTKEIKWLDYEEAKRILSYKLDLQLLDKVFGKK